MCTNINYRLTTLPYYELIKQFFSLCTYYSWWKSCLISYVWALSDCEQWEGSEKFKMKIYVSSWIWTTNLLPVRMLTQHPRPFVISRWEECIYWIYYTWLPYLRSGVKGQTFCSYFVCWRKYVNWNNGIICCSDTLKICNICRVYYELMIFCRECSQW